jgi:hypothetical protein
MANIPGIAGYVQPNVFSRTRTIRRAVSSPGGLRILAIVGLGQAEETLILSAQGGGQDGVNPDFSGSSAPDGRHFELSKTNLVSKRTALLLDGVPLTGVEQTIDLAAFDNRYDYRLEPLTGRIELQRAHLVDVGGEYYVPGTGNVGNGTMPTLTLLDVNAPTETWTVKATSVIRDAYGDPVPGVTVFSAIGSVSGQPIDVYGSPVVFVSDGVVRDNGILRVSISEGAVAFERGDRFTIKVASGVLKVGQTLEAKYIAEENLYDPEFFVDANSLFIKHGVPSESNTLSLGAAMAFENGAFGVLAMQPRPTVPRKTSSVLLARDNPLTATVEGFPALPVGGIVAGDLNNFMYPILNGNPGVDTKVNILVVDKTTGDESQIFPNKVDFYNSTIEADPFNEFVANADYAFSYTVVEGSQVEDEGVDGVVIAGQSTFSAASASFFANNLDLGEADTNKKIKIMRKDAFGNSAESVSGTYEIVSVGGGLGDDTIVTLDTTFSASMTNLVWQLVDEADVSSYLLLTKDLYTSGPIGVGDGLRISFVDRDDADFFDTNWAQAFETLESSECQIVVPLPDATYSAVQQASVAHVELMSSTMNQKERFTLIGAQRGVTSEAVIGRELVAVEDVGVIEGIQGDDAEEVLQGNVEDLQNFDVSVNFGTTFRAMYFWPDEIIRSINGTNTTIHGFYAAAAAGGLLAGTANVATPLTRKILTGFTVPRSKLRRPIILNAMGAVGVSVIQPVVGGGQILHGKTTVSSGDPLEEEPSVVFIRDTTAKSVRSSVQGFIGQPEDSTLAASITSSVVKTLQALVSQGLLSSFRNVSVARDQVEPRQWNVSVEVLPTLPVNWIFVDISVSSL